MSERRTDWYHFLSFFKLLLLMIMISTELASSSRQCLSECGGIQLKFPFGIGKGCSLNKYYEIECRSSSTNASRKGGVPFLSQIDKEVVEISHPYQYTSYYEIVEMSSPYTQHGVVRVKNPIAYVRGCYVDGILDNAETIMNLTGSPFFVDTTNTLEAVGCDSKVSLTHIKPSTTGCELKCYPESDWHRFKIPFYNGRDCSSNILSNAFVNVCRDNEPGDCSGNGCCQISLPHEPHQVLGIKIERNDGINNESCTVSYIADDISTMSMSSLAKQKESMANRYSTISLGWVIQTTNSSFLDSLGCRTKKDFDNATYIAPTKVSCVCQKTTISEVGYANCVCNRGYKGNPYISGGCQDVDECKINSETCGKGKNCVNTMGDYDCVVDNKKAIVIGMGAGFCVLFLISGLWWLRLYLIRRKITNRKKNFFKRNGGLLLQQELHTRENNVENMRIFSSKELEKATENFDQNRVIGKGGQGMVYKGMLADGATVAVKKSTVIDEDRVQEFINEVVILTQLNHRHVVKILGCCLETEVPILVYEYISHGNLFSHIHDDDDDDDDEEYSSDQDYPMKWTERLRIAVEISEALSYLHCSASSPVFHRDIKSTNILLDQKLSAKVADFGTSRSVSIDQTHCTTIVSGTLGYVDPEYYITSHYTAKSDVYSFGVVLAELITGEKPLLTIEDGTTTTRQTISLVDHFNMAVNEGRVLDIMDTRLRRSDCNPEQVIAVGNITFNCLISRGDKRPTMRDVFLELEKIYSNVASSSV